VNLQDERCNNKDIGYNVYLLPSNTTTLINVPVTGSRYTT